MKRNKKELQEENDDNEESEEEDNKNKINNQFTEKEEIKIESLINSVFKDKSKKPEILEKLRPFFSLKVIQREIDRVYTAVEKINPEKIDLIEVNEYKEEKYCEKSLFATKSKSVGLNDFDLDLSASILGHKQSVKVIVKGKI